MIPLEGECVDRRGVPIYRGDLLKTFHFRSGRRPHFLYHVAVLRPGSSFLEMVPVHYLDTGIEDTGGRCFLTPDLASQAQVIAGFGPGACLDFNDRERRK